jgi:hypothetical protein
LARTLVYGDWVQATLLLNSVAADLLRHFIKKLSISAIVSKLLRLSNMERLISPVASVKEFGGGHAKELGIDLCWADPVEIQKWFLATLLFGVRISEKIAAKTYTEFQSAGRISPQKILNAGWNELVRLLGRGGYKRYDFKTADKLLEISNILLQDYAGDLNVLHCLALDEPDLERRIKRRGKGVGDLPSISFYVRCAVSGPKRSHFRQNKRFTLPKRW